MLGGKPPRWMRIGAAAVAAVFCLQLLFGEHGPHDVVWTVVECTLMMLIAIAPRGLYDGRADAWERNHPIASGTLMFVVLSGLLMWCLADYVAWWLAAAIALPGAAVLATWITYRHHIAPDPVSR